MAGEVYLTKEGYEKLQTELERLKTVERNKISRAIGEARLLGDISENAEYDAAKDAQAHCEARIAELEEKLSRVRIIDNEDIPKDKAFIGAFVTIVDVDSGSKDRYMLVSPEESDYESGKISIQSPIGKALLGRQVGEAIEINVPAGTLKYKITKIER
ncbi:MAG TPA: transcription elongation factor GreA [Candidatus Omnitrophota bacterium]|nr:transcription elongation factor GreA [Candidatus Omnitrophota bacterium]HQL41510.1 transcription elongation factor GreA [Candidatus Omnitrophota bacterium]